MRCALCRRSRGFAGCARAHCEVSRGVFGGIVCRRRLCVPVRIVRTRCAFRNLRCARSSRGAFRRSPAGGVRSRGVLRAAFVEEGGVALSGAGRCAERLKFRAKWEAGLRRLDLRIKLRLLPGLRAAGFCKVRDFAYCEILRDAGLCAARERSRLFLRKPPRSFR